jgi:hypothetical protein
MLEKTKSSTVTRFPTCPNKCNARMVPSWYLLSNGAKAPIWHCDECRECSISIVARALVDSKLRSILDYEQALAHVLLEEEIQE